MIYMLTTMKEKMMNYTGSKYEQGRDITEIAKLIRKDIKEVMKKGYIKKSTKIAVKCRRYAGGQSIDVVIQHWDGSIHNPAWVHEHVEMKPHEESILTAAAGQLVATLEDIMSQYNYDHGDSMTDYYDQKFYGGVEFDSKFNNASFEAVKTTLKN